MISKIISGYISLGFNMRAKDNYSKLVNEGVQPRGSAAYPLASAK